jgi:predicted RNA-binding Zn ribbon-like protein
VDYGDYIGNMARLVVEIVNTGGTAALTPDSSHMFDDHGVARPGADELSRLLPRLRAAVAAVAGHGPFEPVNRLLALYPPQMRISDHDGDAHLHYAREDQPPEAWLGRTCAAALAHIACATPLVTIGRCAAAACPNFFVDQSRNRSRRFCSNPCASRTTVAAHRARARGGTIGS